MNEKPIIAIRPLGFPWETQDPFLFCAHHADAYPKGNAEMGPAVSLEGRNLGQDFTIKDGFRMYHGTKVPGFPSHPHRGFETVTLAKEGFVDHSDSLGAAGRFGNGDVQWMTAGKGVQHCEMFPLIEKEKENPLEIFQVWLNLPRANKFVEPHFAMLWQDTIPVVRHEDGKGKRTDINVVAGALDGENAPTPPPDSWAADPANGVAIWTIKMEAGATWTLPKANGEVNRTLYFYEGEDFQAGGEKIPAYHSIYLNPSQDTILENGAKTSYLLMLQGKPINEPVAQYGPFVMNEQHEIREAMIDYQRTEFGGWPWPRTDHVHDRERGRFALHADGREEVK